MIVYNVTIKVDASIAADWIKWLRDDHIPAIINTGCFSNANVMRLLEVDDFEGPTYAVQYLTEDFSRYQLYIDKYAAVMRQMSFDKWGNKFIAFRSVMEVVN
ncbi:MAG: DUF4286 family protein [Ferruginibacter sp.]